MSTGNTPRRRLSPSERRALIIAAATELFAADGYRGTAIGDIAAASGVTPPVIYDHFDSKLELYREVLAHHFAALRETWAEGLAAEGSEEERVAAAFGFWFGYVQEHPDASRLLFRVPSDDREVAAVHAAVTAESRDILMPLLASAEAEVPPSPEQLDMLWEVMRGSLQGLALWWREHPTISHGEMVVAAMSVLWPGIREVRAGRFWQPRGSRSK